MMQTDRMRYAALIMLRGDDPCFMGEFRGDPLEYFEAGRFDAVVIDQ